MTATTRGLLLFTLAVLVVHGVVGALAGRGALDETAGFLHGEQIADSWRPMNVAHAHLKSHPDEPLYAWLFFEQRVKFIYPPTSLLLVEALDRTLPRSAWGAALNALSWLAVVVTVACAALLLDRGLARVAPASARERGLRAAAAVGIGLVFYPVTKAYTLGQAQTLVNAALAALVLSWALGHKRAAGVLLALMCAIKPQYALIGVWGLLRREWTFAAAAAVSGLALLALSVAFFGAVHHLDYLDVLSHISRLGEAYQPNQSVNGLLQRWLGNGVAAHWDPHVYPPYHPVVYAGTLVASLLLLGGALLWPVPAPQRGGLADLGAVVLATTVATPIAWEHHHGVLLPVLALLLPLALVAGTGRVALLAAAALVASTLLPVPARFAGTPWSLLQSTLLLATLATLGLLLERVHRGPAAPSGPPDGSAAKPV